MEDGFTMQRAENDDVYYQEKEEPVDKVADAEEIARKIIQEQVKEAEKIKKQQLLKGYNTGLNLSIIGFVIIIILCVFYDFVSVCLVADVCVSDMLILWGILVAASIVVAIQEFKQGNMLTGISLIIFGTMTWGIYPMITAFFERARLNKYKDNDELSD